MYGSEPVPCPFCGLGGPEQGSEADEAPEGLGFEDSSDALRHALFETDPGTGSGEASELTGYW